MSPRNQSDLGRLLHTIVALGIVREQGSEAATRCIHETHNRALRWALNHNCPIEAIELIDRTANRALGAERLPNARQQPTRQAV